MKPTMRYHHTHTRKAKIRLTPARDNEAVEQQEPVYEPGSSTDRESNRHLCRLRGSAPPESATAPPGLSDSQPSPSIPPTKPLLEML